MPNITSQQLINELLTRALHTSQKELANSLGISPQYLNDVLNGRREPGRKLLEAMGYKRTVTYTKVEK